VNRPIKLPIIYIHTVAANILLSIKDIWLLFSSGYVLRKILVCGVTGVLLLVSHLYPI